VGTWAVRFLGCPMERKDHGETSFFVWNNMIPLFYYSLKKSEIGNVKKVWEKGTF
jgi:hypothetical protein